MTAAHQLTQEKARRIAVRAQLLDAERPTDLVALVEHLLFLQLDPTAAVAPSADLVAWSRLGGDYQPQQLLDAVERDRTLYEVRAFYRPTSHLGLYLAEMAAGPEHRWHRQWLEANDAFRRFVLDLLRDSGPLLSRDIPDKAAVPWTSTGWTNDRNVTQMLEFLNVRGEIAITARQGRQRVWDLAERVYPSEVSAVPLEAARGTRDRMRLRSLGLARAKDVREAGEPARVEGTRGLWRVDPEALDQPFEGRTALLSPFDRLVHDRKRALELFGFEYQIEMYLPKQKRRWGYFALPVLHDDRLVGKVDATADRKTGVFRVDALHQDVPFSRAMTRAVNAELAALASWLGLTLTRA